ncbi:MAG: TetR/AcrR family transcriptional regulator [Bryobacteraceae bacterium]|nr:TetR/AcrR family transcriptional regulator [Bryobacteraceae bacterium]
MRSPTKREASRQRIVEAAGRAFRSKGLAGVGVDGLAQGAELTSGAFYFHFASKMEAFVEAVRAGLQDLKLGIENFRSSAGTGWLEAFVDFYLSERRTCDASEGCALPSLSADVERAGPEARAAYEANLREVAAAAAQGLPPGSSLTSQEQSWALLALLSGGVTMARAVSDPRLSEEIASAVRKAARELAVVP